MWDILKYLEDIYILKIFIIKYLFSFMCKLYVYIDLSLVKIDFIINLYFQIKGKI